MTFDEIKSNYRMLNIKKRLLILACLALIPCIFDAFDRWPVLTEERDSAQVNKDAAEKKFEEANKKKNELPKLEEKLLQSEAEMVEARRKLPDELHMNQILEKTEILSQQDGVVLNAFDPGEGVISESAFKFVELPVKINVTGTFGQIVSFFDHLVHLEILVNLRNIALNLDKDSKPNPNSGKDITLAQKLSEEEAQRKLRYTAKVTASCDMVLFRSLDAEEAKAISEALAKREAKIKAEKAEKEANQKAKK